MSLKYVLLLVISLEVITISFSCQPPQNCENITSRNSTQMSGNVHCGPANISCGLGQVCRDGVCTDLDSKTPGGGGGPIPSMSFPYRTDGALLTNTRPTRPLITGEDSTESHHSLISGNQEFLLALVGFSLLFMNFCLVSFCLGRYKRRRLQQQRLAATRATQSSQTGDGWNDHMFQNRGIENFALNGDLDSFASEFMFSPVHLPPYDLSSAYHKPRPRLEGEEGGGAEGDSSPDNFDTQSIPANEDPPPYSDQQYDSSCKPPSYEEALTVVATHVEESTSGL